MNGVLRVRVTRLRDGWRAEIPGMKVFRTGLLPTKREAVERLRQDILNDPNVTALEVDEVLVRMDRPFTED